MAISGVVQNGRALVPLTFRIAGSPDISFEFRIDTGFQGYLTLPSAAIAALHLPLVQNIVTRLADGSRQWMNSHQAIIVWEGAEQGVQVLATGNRPLLGAALLDGNLLSISYEDSGSVTITPLSVSAS